MQASHKPQTTTYSLTVNIKDGLSLNIIKNPYSSALHSHKVLMK